MTVEKQAVIAATVLAVIILIAVTVALDFTAGVFVALLAWLPLYLVEARRRKSPN